LEIIKSWKGNPLTPIQDIFNDKLDFSCNTFDDIVRLNAGLLSTSQKYELFGTSTKAQQELQKFLNNFELLQIFLGQIEEKFIEVPSSRVKYEKELQEINQKVNALLPLVKFQTSNTSRLLQQFSIIYLFTW
jgi:hypothetical protein